MGISDLTSGQQPAAAQQQPDPAQLDQAHSQIDQLLQIISGIKDQASYDDAKKQYQQMGGDASDLPEKYDPAEVQQFAQQLISAKQQMSGGAAPQTAQAAPQSGIGAITGGSQWP